MLHYLIPTPEMVQTYVTELAQVRQLSAAIVQLHRSTCHQGPTDHEGMRRVIASLFRGTDGLGAVESPFSQTNASYNGNYRTRCLACFKAVFSALSAGERRGSDCESGYSHTTPSPSPSCMYW